MVVTSGQEQVSRWRRKGGTIKHTPHRAMCKRNGLISGNERIAAIRTGGNVGFGGRTALVRDGLLLYNAIRHDAARIANPGGGLVWT
jgi:hypothetical protein